MSFVYDDENTGVLLVRDAARKPQTLGRLAASFDALTWFGVFATFLCVFLVLRLLVVVGMAPQETDGQTMFYLVRISLHQPPFIAESPTGVRQRLVYSVLWFFMLVLATAFSSALVSQMTLPSLTKPVDTIAEAEQAGLIYNIETTSEEYKLITQHIHPTLRILEAKYPYFDVTKLQIEGRLQRFPTVYDALNASFANRGVTPLSFLRGVYADPHHRFHMMKETVHMSSGSYYRPHLFGIGEFLKLKRHLMDTGHRKRWLNLVFHREWVRTKFDSSKENPQESNSNLVHVVPVFYLLGFGYGAAVLLFIIECCIGGRQLCGRITGSGVGIQGKRR